MARPTPLTRNPDEILPRSLRSDERAIGDCNEFVGAGFRFEHADADAHGDRKWIVNGVLLNLTTNPFSHVHRDLRGRARHDDDELFAAESGADVENPHPPAQQIGDVPQGAVPLQMPPAYR